MERHSAPPGEAWRLGRGPFIFSGVPPMCIGNLDLVNESDQKIRVRTIPVVGHEVHAVANPGLTELKVGTRLGPRAHSRAHTFFLLDPSTPPGTYTGDLSCGNQHEPVIVHVWREAGPEGQSERDPAPWCGWGRPDGGRRDLERGKCHRDVARDPRPFSMRRTGSCTPWCTRRDTNEKDEYQAYLNRVVHELRGRLARPARVTLRGEPSELQPGETRVVELEITLPAELVKGRTYYGSTPFMSGNLNFEVECNGASKSTIRRPK